jgi:hypothetical protein
MVEFFPILFPLDCPKDVITDLQRLFSNEEKGNNSRGGSRVYELAGGFQILNSDWTMVHGIVTLKTGEEYKHAFCEKDGMVYDPVFDEFYDKEAYYEHYDVHGAKYYTIIDATVESFKYGTCGPWPQSLEEAIKMFGDIAEAKKRMNDRVLFVVDQTTDLRGICVRSKLDAGNVPCPCGKGKLKKKNITNGYFCPVCGMILNIRGGLNV